MAVIEEFDELMRGQGYSIRTITRYLRTLRKYKEYWEIKNIQFKDLTWTHLRDWKKHMIAIKMSHRTLNEELKGIKAYYKLVAQDTMSRDAINRYTKMEMIKAPKLGKRLGYKPIKYDVLMELIEKTKVDSELHCLCMTLLYTGGRAQIYGLHEKNIDFARGIITIIVKGNKELAIPLHDDLAPILKQRIKEGTYNDGFLFRNGRDPTTNINQHNNWNNCYNKCKRMGALIGNGHIHPHRFRKTLPTLGKHLGIDLQTMQRILGHAKITTTADIYTELEMDDIKEEYGKMSFIHKDNEKDSTELGDLISVIKGLSKEKKQKVILALMEG
jgi:site-specific recombinase XerD